MSREHRENLFSGDQPIPPNEVRRRYAEVLRPAQIVALDVLFGLRASVQGVDNALARWLGPDALTPGRFQVLVVLWAADRAVPQREIVEALDVSRATVSALVEILLAAGHVRVTPGSADKRHVLVELTAAGRATTLRLVKSNAARLRQTFGAFTDSELRTLVDLLLRLNASVER
jgi:DNA-binding MarR family transcriptional regulator